VRHCLNEVLDDRVSIHARHHEVENDGVERFLVQSRDGLSAVGDGHGLESGAVENAADQDADGVFIVGNENPWRVWFSHFHLRFD
jgi:hypothetical protein